MGQRPSPTPVFFFFGLDSAVPGNLGPGWAKQETRVNQITRA
jgi:hypothetical protein